MNDPSHHAKVKDSWLVGKALLNFTSVFVLLGVFLFGFEQGLMSSLLTNKYFKNYYGDPTPVEIGTMIAILEIGALFSSLVAGKCGDLVGRRRTIRYGSFIFVVGGLVQSCSVNIWNLAFGRLIGGIAIGFLTTIIPCYQLEISPADDRGFYACLEFTGNIFGYSASIWVDYAFSYVEGNWLWRAPLFVQCVVGFLLFLGSFVIVETPRWLLEHDHDEEGMVVIADLNSEGDVEDELSMNEYRLIKETVLLDRLDGGERSYHYLFTRYRKRLSVACFSQMFAQLNGINIISYYAPMIFELAGWIGRRAILMTGINSIVYLLSTFPPWRLVDQWGRKPLLILGLVLMGIPLLATALLLKMDNEHTPITVVCCIIMTNAAFGYSWGPIPWLMSEVFPNSVRSKGAAMLTATNWLFNFLVGELTPIFLATIKWKTYLIPASSCFLSLLAVHFLFPETKGLNLENMGLVFDDSLLVFSFHNAGTSTRSAAPSLYALSSRRASFGVDDRNAPILKNAQFARLDPPSTAPSIHESSTQEFIQEIQPPSYKRIIAWKSQQQRNQNRILKFLSKRPKTDEERPLLH